MVPTDRKLIELKRMLSDLSMELSTELLRTINDEIINKPPVVVNWSIHSSSNNTNNTSNSSNSSNDRTTSHAVLASQYQLITKFLNDKLNTHNLFLELLNCTVSPNICLSGVFCCISLFCCRFNLLFC